MISTTTRQFFSEELCNWLHQMAQARDATVGVLTLMQCRDTSGRHTAMITAPGAMVAIDLNARSAFVAQGRAWARVVTAQLNYGKLPHKRYTRLLELCRAAGINLD